LANTKSAKKAIRVQERKSNINRPVRSSVKTAVTKARKLILEKDLDAAKDAVKQATRELDMAAQKGVIHPNNAARRKSRLAKQLNDAVAAGSAPKEE
jgi:small subunit ribosomal protein S20